jgi:hypothetical protein
MHGKYGHVGKLSHYFSIAFFPGGNIDYRVASNVSPIFEKDPLDAFFSRKSVDRTLITTSDVLALPMSNGLGQKWQDIGWEKSFLSNVLLNHKFSRLSRSTLTVHI